MMTCHSETTTSEARALYWEHRAMQLEAALSDSIKIADHYKCIAMQSEALALELQKANAYIADKKL